MKFSNSPEDQALAGVMFDAMRQANLDRKDGKPLLIDKNGRAVYQILLGGLRWHKVCCGVYTATLDGKRNYRVLRVREGWTTTGPGFSEKTLRTMREAREFCENEARRTPLR
jgi:hypothetical protein